MGAISRGGKHTRTGTSRLIRTRSMGNPSSPQFEVLWKSHSYLSLVEIHFIRKNVTLALLLRIKREVPVRIGALIGKSETSIYLKCKWHMGEGVDRHKRAPFPARKLFFSPLTAHTDKATQAQRQKSARGN